MSAAQTVPAKSSTRLLTVILILQAMTLLGQWIGLPSATTPAHAQIPDGGAQRIQIIDELKSLNGKFDKLLTMLDSGKLEIKVAADEKAGK